MKIRLISGTPVLLLFLSVGAHAGDYPSEIKLDHPEQRMIVAQPGKTLAAMQSACAQSMLNQSPATEARDISEKILRTEDEVVIEVDADLVDVPLASGKKNLSATYRCEYRDGYLTLGIWTRGLVGKWMYFDMAQLTPNDLGTPWPE